VTIWVEKDTANSNVELWACHMCVSFIKAPSVCDNRRALG